ncbi:MAG TPA: hypothetical protein VGS11_11165 [Candidatus Bathyarchaeia archaeon]|nr:hypothetical protein [Candidatus Bathyarchaeia archaeon]
MTVESHELRVQLRVQTHMEGEILDITDRIGPDLSLPFLDKEMTIIFQLVGE